MNFNVSFFGKSYEGNFSNFIDWSTYYYGAYCKEELLLIKDVLTQIKNPVIVDVGANVGHHSLFAAKYAMEVHSFEPLSEVFIKIHQKIKTNGITNIIVHEIGLGNTDEHLPYTMPIGCNSGTGSFSITTESNSKTVLLPIRRGDQFFQDLKLTQIDFIKMDIEGFEPQALRGMRTTIEKYRPLIFFEWSQNQRKTQFELDQFFPEGYKIFNFLEHKAIMGIFNKTGYLLKEESRWNYSDGNKIALPIEKAHLLKRMIAK